MTPSKDQNIFEEKNGKGNLYSKSIDDKIKEIEARIKSISESNIPDFLKRGDKYSIEQLNLKQKFDVVNENINNLTKEINPAMTSSQLSGAKDIGIKDTSVPDIEKTLNEINQKISNLSKISQTEDNTKEQPKISTDSNDLHKKVFNTFYEEKPVEKLPDEEPKDSHVKNKLEDIDQQIKDIKDTITSLYDKSKVDTNIKVEERLKSIEEKLTDETEMHGAVAHGPITMRPLQKKEGLFNDVNLTEDYELGFRFYQLGFKTGFFNVKLDKDDEASRIATAEFFPNTFWSSVKQRSRWVAGIVFQNWKAHKWTGNLSTKYFLFRDRKSLFSFFSAFLSNIVILYMIFAIGSRIFGWQHVNSLVGNSSVLWYLMIANLFFMISRLSHRFLFTYNWYGFKYAFFSIFRLPLDTVINFFAIARSISVYRNTKSQTKAVWDSTSHY